MSSERTSGQGLAALVDLVMPESGSLLDRLSDRAQQALGRVADRPAGRGIVELLRGNAWLGHPAHPLVIAVPVGAWVVSAWYDLRGASTGDATQDRVADAALGAGVVGAGVAAVTGLAQYLDTDGAARRETAVHAALNSVALGCYTASWLLRVGGRRRPGRRAAAAGLALVAASGYLGGDLAYRHGVGVQPQS